MAKSPVVLIIRDGWGVNPGGRELAVENGDATLLSQTPFHDYLYATYPQARLSASGMDVGLPDGQMGNSEVGHLNLGAGRIVYQDLTRINKAILDGEFDTSPVLIEAFAKAKAKGSRLHLIGLVSKAGKNQLRAAETEKYPHVTFFFNGGIEDPYPGEDRYLAISPKEVPTYDKKPQMSGPDLAFEVYRRLEQYDLVIVNFANPDMVGHTGVVEAGIHACETIDLAVRLLVEKTLALGGKLLITADHGNCEQMRNHDGTPNTAHTTNLVHLLYVAADAPTVKLDSGILADVAPTLLALLGIAQPPEMTGRSLVGRR